jgi:hypothetical protein
MMLAHVVAILAVSMLFIFIRIAVVVQWLGCPVDIVPALFGPPRLVLHHPP